MPGIQAFVGSLDGSPNLPTLAGTPIHKPSDAFPGGSAAHVSFSGIDFAASLGQVYLEAAKDGQGRWLDGGRTYRLTVPKDVPVAQFWSVTVYDNESRCFVNSGVSPDRSSRDAIVTPVASGSPASLGTASPTRGQRGAGNVAVRPRERLGRLRRYVA